jgi:Tfp pilus assembly protein PilW
MKHSKTTRLMSLLLWGIFSVFLVSTNAYAQTAKVSGTIINQRTAEPVAGATVTVKHQSICKCGWRRKVYD